MSPNQQPKQAKAPAAQKPAVEVPKTEISINEAKQNREFMIIMIVVAAVICLVGSFLTYRLFKNYLHRTNEIKAQQIYRDALQKKKDDLAVLKTNLEKMKTSNNGNLAPSVLALHALPMDEEYKTLIGTIENLGNEAQVDATIGGASSTTVAAPAPAGAAASSATATAGVTKYPFTVAVSGSYDNVLRFLSATENSLRPMDFESMSISGTSGDITASFSFNTYWQGAADISNKTMTLPEYNESLKNAEPAK